MKHCIIITVAVVATICGASGCAYHRQHFAGPAIPLATSGPTFPATAEFSNPGEVMFGPPQTAAAPGYEMVRETVTEELPPKPLEAARNKGTAQRQLRVPMAKQAEVNNNQLLWIVSRDLKLRGYSWDNACLEGSGQRAVVRAYRDRLLYKVTTFENAGLVQIDVLAVADQATVEDNAREAEKVADQVSQDIEAALSKT